MAADLLETLIFHKEGCVGMAANMIGVNKRIIALENEGVLPGDVQPGNPQDALAPMTPRRAAFP